MNKKLILFLVVMLTVLSACQNEKSLTPEQTANETSNRNNENTTNENTIKHPNEETAENAEIQLGEETVEGTEIQPSEEIDEVEIDDKINDEVIKVIHNHISAVRTTDEELIRSTVLDNLDFEERVFVLWNDNSIDYEIKKMEYGMGNEKNEVVTVTFTNDKILSFALTKKENGWKIYDID